MSSIYLPKSNSYGIANIIIIIKDFNKIIYKSYKITKSTETVNAGYTNRLKIYYRLSHYTFLITIQKVSNIYYIFDYDYFYFEIMEVKNSSRHEYHYGFIVPPKKGLEK